MIHKYSLFGYNIVLDVESGAIHSVSEIAYKMLDYIGLMLNENRDLPEKCPMDIRYQLAKYESVQINENYSELRELYYNGMLFSEEIRIKQSNSEVPLKAMCLHISHDCNMKCEYCFAGKGNFGMNKAVMDEDTALRAVRFLMDNSSGKKNLEVDFFGGEPLMNFDTIKKVIEKTRKIEKEKNKNVRFTLTTNGTLLDNDIIDYINENIYNIVLSLDGEKNTNDRVRRYNDDSGTYSDVISKYQSLVSKRGTKDYYIRGTFTRYNLDFCKDIQHISALGFKNISMEPVVTEEENGFSIREQDLPIVFAEYEKLAKIIIKDERGGKEKFNFFHFNIDLDQGPCVYKRIKGCGSGSEYIAITPEGDIYPCHQFVGLKNSKIGNINIGEIDRGKMQAYKENNIVTNEKCSSCWVKYFCGGGCAANNMKFNGNIKEPYNISCELEKKRIECAIAIKVANVNI